MSSPTKFSPKATAETAFFWDATARGELHLQRCRDCDAHYFPPRPFCPTCLGDDVVVERVSGRGRLHTYLINHRPAPGFEDEAPYVIAVVALAEGPRMMANLVEVEAAPQALELDMALEVTFEDQGGMQVPKFRPATTTEEAAGLGTGTERRRPSESARGAAGLKRTTTAATAAIVGAAETDELGTLPGVSEIQLHAQASRNALADAELTVADVDGIAAVGQAPIALAHYLGIEPAWIDGTSVGGASFMFHVRHAAAAIAAGLCSTVLISHGQSGRSRVGGPGVGRARDSLSAQFETPHGIVGPPTLFPIGVLRYLHETGTTHEQLASVAVAQRRWAAMSPKAKYRDEITVEDVFASPMIAYPMHQLECCLVTDGGGALILTSAERAEGMDLPHPPVHLLGAGEAMETPMVSQMEDVTRSKAFRRSSAAAFGQAGITTDDVDHLMVYDAFAHLPIYGLEDLGFVGRGEGGAFVEEGHTSPGGRLPMNTNGGGLSYTHTGMYGMFAIQESVRQVRGTAPAQVEGVEISVAQGVGGMFASGGTVVLGRERT